MSDRTDRGVPRIYYGAKEAQLIKNYFSVVMEDAPISYWRLGEISGTRAEDSSGFGNHGTYSSGCILNAPSSLSKDSNPSVVFNGSSGNIITTNTYANPQRFSLEARFRTTATNTPGIIGLQAGGFFDRRLYLDSTGKINFMIFADSNVIITTPLAYNDGNWHSVVITFDSTVGRTIYVDGALAASAPAVIAQNYTGKWVIGNPQATNFFNGGLDEIAIYPTALSADRVLDHYQNV